MTIQDGEDANSLAEELKGIRKACKDSAIGPLHAASVVEKLGREWHLYEPSAGGKSISYWLQAVCGKGKHHGWFLTRFHAIEVLGGIRLTCRLHHEAAVWAVRGIPSEKRDEFMRLIVEEYIRNGSSPLTKSQAKRVAKSMNM